LRAWKASSISKLDKLDVSYQQLAAAAIATCPGNAGEIRLVGALGEDYGDVRYDCVIDGRLKQGVKSETSRDWQVYKTLQALREQMTSPGQKPWSKCVFTLFPDGKFKFDVSYDD